MGLVSQQSCVFSAQIEHFFKNYDVLNTALTNKLLKKFLSLLFVVRPGHKRKNIWVCERHLIFLADLCKIGSVVCRQSV